MTNGEEKYYHYTGCGLDYIYLANGVNIRESVTGQGELVSINNLDSLHRAIGKWVIDNKPVLGSKEIRFFRSQLDFSQFKLAALLGKDEQTVGRWERDEGAIDPSSDRLIRVFYREFLKKNANAMKICEHLDELQEQEHDRQVFRASRNNWSFSEAA